MFAQLFCYKQEPLTLKSSPPPGLFPTGSVCPCTVVLTTPLPDPANHVPVTLGHPRGWGVLTVSLPVQAEKQRPLTLYGRQTTHRAGRRVLEGAFQHRCGLRYPHSLAGEPGVGAREHGQYTQTVRLDWCIGEAALWGRHQHV